MSDRLIHNDRLFPADPASRNVARELYTQVKHLPIISPHGHTDPQWFADDTPFSNPTELLLAPDHYLYRMMFSQGVSLQQLSVPGRHDVTVADPRRAWREFAAHYFLFRGTPSALWLEHVFAELFGIDQVLNAGTADFYYDTIDDALKQEAFRPRALFDTFNIEVLATTESPLDPLDHHQAIQASQWPGRVITTYRPDPVVDPEHEGFEASVTRFGEITGEDVEHWQGYLNAHRSRRAYFKSMGATATDHGHPSAQTADLSTSECNELYAKIRHGHTDADSAELFRAQMLTEMARMSLDDGMVMQIHAGAHRNHNPWVFEHYGRDKGADIPQRVDFVHALKPLLSRLGTEPGLSIILFTLDESTYSRELAPLAGHYACLKLGPPWWFFDSPEGMRRFRELTTETAGFYNTVGFNDDTRAFLSIPARHDIARRADCGFLARLVVEHRLRLEDALELATELAYSLSKKAYRLDQKSEPDASLV